MGRTTLLLSPSNSIIIMTHVPVIYNKEFLATVLGLPHFIVRGQKPIIHVASCAWQKQS